MRRPIFILAFCTSLRVFFSCGDILMPDTSEVDALEESSQNFPIEIIEGFELPDYTR